MPTIVWLTATRRKYRRHGWREGEQWSLCGLVDRAERHLQAPEANDPYCGSCVRIRQVPAGQTYPSVLDFIVAFEQGAPMTSD